MRKVVRLTESELVNLIRRVIKESDEQNSELVKQPEKKIKFFFPDANLKSSDGSFFHFLKADDYGTYQPIFFEQPEEYSKYLNSLKPADRDILIDQLLNYTLIEASGQFNKINFREGIPDLLQGTGFGYKIYEDFIKFKKFASSYGAVTDDAKNIWKKISQDPDFYSVRYKDGSILAVYKKWDGDTVKKIKEFISFQGEKEIDHISDTLLSDFPEFNKYL
jgi:hypothetical protein